MKHLAGAVQQGWLQGEQLKLGRSGVPYFIPLRGNWKMRPVTCPNCHREIKRRKWQRACSLICFFRLTGQSLPEALVKSMDDLPRKVHTSTPHVPWWLRLLSWMRRGWRHVWSH